MDSMEACMDRVILNIISMVGQLVVYKVLKHLEATEKDTEKLYIL